MAACGLRPRLEVSVSTSFAVDLSDVDRGVYEALTFTVTSHPSESGPYLIARVLAYLLEFREGLAFSRGLSNGEEPALWAHDLTGALTGWVEIGLPDPARLHKASKASPHVVVYAHKDPRVWLRSLVGAKVHKAESIGVVELDRPLLTALEARLARRNVWSVSVSDGELYVQVGDEALTGALVRHAWPVT